jgi:hypothetical protein
MSLASASESHCVHIARIVLMWVFYSPAASVALFEGVVSHPEDGLLNSSYSPTSPSSEPCKNEASVQAHNVY